MLWELGGTRGRVLGQHRATAGNEKWSGRWESNPHGRRVRAWKISGLVRWRMPSACPPAMRTPALYSPARGGTHVLPQRRRPRRTLACVAHPFVRSRLIVEECSCRVRRSRHSVAATVSQCFRNSYRRAVSSRGVGLHEIREHRQPSAIEGAPLIHIRQWRDSYGLAPIKTDERGVH